MPCICPPSAACWSWALEWNQNSRLVALFGEIEPAREVAAALPALDVMELRQTPTRTTRMRVETELSADQDILFTHERPSG